MSRSMLVLIGWLFSWSVSAAEPAIPHAQDKPPNEPRDAATAAQMMTVPPGFVVEVVAAEPDVVNPVAMAIDEKRRFWITESLEYPRRSAGPGRDRVKILEDTDGDGRVDKTSVFLDGLNIPSGVQIGHGGVWIANAPDLLFVPDANRDGVPDGPAQIVVTGFGRTDTHELPNSLTWGPDGWLYGLNGVFNHSHVKYSETNPNYAAAGGKDQKGWPITCALFRIHPRTWEFEVFCEGTSNPWGIAFNDEGDAFVSACVIDHLWHLVETGYYHRQGGPYPPHTWKIDSIVKHKHQKAAYCGITWFDSDAYPEQYRRKLYMGNIHGGCINVDRIERNGSTYAGFGEPDFLTANDSWFMPVVQKTGPDGCLYILDWYDRYHCYQDANRDPAGIDRLKGRLYRVRYVGNNEPEASAMNSSSARFPRDLATVSDNQLIDGLGHPNVWVRETAQRLLTERGTPAIAQQLLANLRRIVIEDAAHSHCVWTLISLPETAVPTQDLLNQLEIIDDQDFSSGVTDDASLTANWLLRIAGDRDIPVESLPREWLNHVLKREQEPAALQAAIALGKSSETSHAAALWLKILQAHGDDMIKRIVWQNLKLRLPQSPEIATPFLIDPELSRHNEFEDFRQQLLRWLLAQPQPNHQVLQDILAHGSPATTRSLLQQLATLSQTGELAESRRESLIEQLSPALADILKQPTHPLFVDAVLLSTTWKQTAGYAEAGKVLASSSFASQQRLAAASALIAAGQDEVLRAIATIFDEASPDTIELRGHLLASLARLDDPEVGQFALHYYSQLPPDLQQKAIELLTQRPEWSKQLLTAIGTQKIPPSVLNVNHARKLAESKDETIRELLAKHWGVLREGRSSDRERVIAEMRSLIRKTPGDAVAGELAFKKVCAQCHKIYGAGAEVGPDITLNGRNDFTQLLSNVFDPSLVIGSGYRSYTVATEDGRVLNGLLVEESQQRVVLKVQGGKQEVIARDEIETLKVNEISLMPEQLERQLSPQEIADLFAFLTLDKHPSDPSAKRLAGVYSVAPRASTNPADFANIVQEVAPGFTEVRSGEGGVALLEEFRGRTGVVRTHPISRDQPGVLIREVTLPVNKKARLIVDVSHDQRGDWRLVATAGSGGRIIDELVGPNTCPDGWGRFSASLEKFAGQTVKITLYNQANDWAWEFAYWGAVTIEME